ncbi:hypothetical protein ACFQ4K_29080 [Tistrella bauzanensis]
MPGNSSSKRTQKTNCLIEKMGYYLDLSDPDIAHLASLQKHEQNWRQRDIVRESGAPADLLYVVKSGGATPIRSWSMAAGRCCRSTIPAM